MTGEQDDAPGDAELTRLTRRTFLGVGGGTLAAALMVSLTDCSSVVVRQLTPLGNKLELPLARYPELDARDGSMRVQLPGSDTPIYILATGDRQFTALSPICTHLGCTVDISGTYLVCPCHGSTYDRSGQVVRGPARRALRSYRTELMAGGVLVIHLGPPESTNG